METQVWKLKTFDSLANSELYAIIKARTDVFVVEQQCAYEEADNKDQNSLHLYMEKDGGIIAYARLLPAGLAYPEASIGRVMVDKKYRGRGYAAALLEKAINVIVKDWAETKIRISAQYHLKDFYRRFGFVESSEAYVEDGIPHIDMTCHAESL